MEQSPFENVSEDEKWDKQIEKYKIEFIQLQL